MFYYLHYSGTQINSCSRFLISFGLISKLGSFGSLAVRVGHHDLTSGASSVALVLVSNAQPERSGHGLGVVAAETRVRGDLAVNETTSSSNLERKVRSGARVANLGQTDGSRATFGVGGTAGVGAVGADTGVHGAGGSA